MLCQSNVKRKIRKFLSTIRVFLSRHVKYRYAHVHILFANESENFYQRSFFQISTNFILYRQSTNVVVNNAQQFPFSNVSIIDWKSFLENVCRTRSTNADRRKWRDRKLAIADENREGGKGLFIETVFIQRPLCCHDMNCLLIASK